MTEVDENLSKGFRSAHFSRQRIYDYTNRVSILQQEDT